MSTQKPPGTAVPLPRIQMAEDQHQISRQRLLLLAVLFASFTEIEMIIPFRTYPCQLRTADKPNHQEYLQKACPERFQNRDLPLRDHKHNHRQYKRIFP
jgi:hypothetical protein